MITTAVIPVHGRLRLLRRTIERLFKRNGVTNVIAVGDSLDEYILCDMLGCKWVYADNFPLGAKWNKGFQAALDIGTDVFIFVGSGDWISDNWIPEGIKHLEGCDMIGKPDFYLADVGMEEIRVCHWKGYTETERIGEPIGIGRMLTRDIVMRMEGKPFDDTHHSGLDWDMYCKVRALGGTVKVITDEAMRSLSVSHYGWENKHKFLDHWYGILPSDIIVDTDKFIKSGWEELLKV